MSKKVRWIVTALVAMLCFVFAFAGCKQTEKPNDGDTQTNPSPIAEITLSEMKTDFAYGEEFSSNGLIVTVVRENGTSYRAKKSDYEVDSTAYDKSVAGEYQITVKLKDSDISKSYSVTVAEPVPVPTEITLSGMQTNFEYARAFSSDGLVVTVKLSSGSNYEAKTSEYEIDYSAYDAYTAGEYEIVVKLKNSTIKQTYQVTVAEEVVYSWADDGALKILTIGNSFSDDTMEYAWQIANSLGIKQIYLGNLYIGGCTLDMHANNAANNAASYEYRVNTNGTWSTTNNYRMGDAIASQDWDFVSLQQASGSSGAPSTYAKVQQLIDYVKNKLPETSHAKIVWNMTWAYQSNSTHAEFYKYNSNQMTMYQKIVETVNSQILTNRNFAAVIPNGTAIQNARTSFLGDSLTRDGYHLTLDIGRYIAGLTLIHSLTGLSVENIGYRPANISAEEAAVAVESAINAVKTPFAVTPSAHTEEILFDTENYTELDLELTLGFYDSTFASNYLNIRTDAGELSAKFFATKRFTIEELPIGSIITVARGWQYRPEAWRSEAKQNSRPDNVTARVVTVTADWWNGYTKRAFNISKTGTPVITGQGDAAKAAFKIYLPKENEEDVLLNMGYTRLSYDLTQGFYNSADVAQYGNVITADANLSHKFYATKRFTKQELPVGSVIVIETGWQYRPEAWKEDAQQTTRPANVTQSVIVIGEDWWSGYLYRAFNLGKTDSSSIAGQEDAVRAAFRIYVPKAD